MPSLALQAAGSGLITNGSFATAAIPAEIVAAVAGKSHFVKSIMIACITNTTVTVATASETIIGTYETDTTSRPHKFTFNQPIKTTAGEAINIQTAGFGRISVVVQGYTE